jgi:YVTN family beta-propeller protein
MKRTCQALSLFAFLAGTFFVSPSRADTVLVVCKSEFQVALVDPATDKILLKLPTGRGPHEVAVSPEGSTAYVSNFGRYSIYPPGDTQHDQPGNTITVIDVPTRKVKTSFDLGTHTGPHGMVVSHDGKLLWATSETPQAVLEIDTSTGKILHVWNTNQQRSHMIVVTPQETKFYVTNTVSGTVSTIDKTTGAVKVINTGPGTEGIAISPDGKEVWAASRLDAKISVISTDTDAIVASFPSGGSQPKRMAFTPDGSQVWVTNYKSNQVSVFDAHGRELLGEVTAEKAPSGVEISPDGHRAYVTNANANKLTVIDVASRKITDVLAIGTDPDGVVWAKQ